MPEDTAFQIANVAVLAADDRKGTDIVVLSLEGITVLTEYFVIVTGFSKNQVRAIAKHIQSEVAEKCDRLPLRVSGEMDASWVVQDFGEVIIHIMQPREREFYALESFWGHAPRLMLTKTA
jgi:ribosome-associated protein